MNSPSYFQNISIVNKRKSYIHQLLFSLALSLFIIFTAVKLTLMFKPLYYFDIGYLNIAEQSSYSKAEIIKNYDYVINYLISPRAQEFQLPSIPYSKFGQIHFKDVKRIFTTIDILLITTGLISLGGLIINIKKKDFAFLKLTPTMLILLPAVLLTSFAINFNKAFVLFHKIFFKNDYWQFDPQLDPIINILPEEFFMHSALMIVFIIIFSIVTLAILNRRLHKKRQT
jgi:integral membrane protein (TIGR01906 family)